VPIDPSATIAPTARIHPGAVIGPQCNIGEYCVVEQDAVLGRANRLEPYVYVKRWTTLGDENEISAGAVLGTDPFDKAFQGHRSFLTIGHRNKIREHWTISRGTKPEAVTRVGDDNFIMGSGHIAHDGVVGNGCTIASCALLAGYVEVEDQAFISGGVVVHQYSKIGRLAMVGGNTRVNSDLPPFFLYSGFHVGAMGLNIVGLRRAGVPVADVRLLKQAYRYLYRSGLARTEALARMRTLGSPLTAHLVDFIQRSRRGIAGEARKEQAG
jgi:UDP-N-acetylglucosamine acyltransferase